MASYTVLHGTADIVNTWAFIRAALVGKPLADSWIAATALAYGLELVTHNPGDFRRVLGLAVVSEAPEPRPG